jgi:hypothetical protein
MNPTYNYQYSGNVPPEAAGAMAALFGGMFLFFLLLLLVKSPIAPIPKMPGLPGFRF